MPLLRSMLFVPAYKEKFLEKSIKLNPDALILDLEDSVPSTLKNDARQNIRDFSSRYTDKKKIFVRLNSYASGQMYDDLNYVMVDNVDGFMPSMIMNEDDIIHIDQIITDLELERGYEKGRFKLCPLIETGQAVLRSYEIAKSSTRLVGLAFGGQDYLTDINGLNMTSGMSILVARSMIVMASKAFSLEAIDTPYLQVPDLEGFKKNLEISRALGFSGRLIIHPSQIQEADAAFSPSESEVSEAQEIINFIEANRDRGEGLNLLRGELVGPPMELRAKKILETWAKIMESKIHDYKK